MSDAGWTGSIGRRQDRSSGPGKQSERVAWGRAVTIRYHRIPTQIRLSLQTGRTLVHVSTGYNGVECLYVEGAHSGPLPAGTETKDAVVHFISYERRHAEAAVTRYAGGNCPRHNLDLLSGNFRQVQDAPLEVIPKIGMEACRATYLQ